MSCTVSCPFVGGLGERYVCRAHPSNKPHQCHVSIPCLASRASTFDGKLSCPISGRVFGDAEDPETVGSMEPPKEKKPRNTAAVASEIEETVRELVAVSALGAKTDVDEETHVEAYVQELVRLWGVYDTCARTASTQLAPVTPRSFAMGTLYHMLEGLAFNNTVVMPRDPFLKRIFPNSAQIEKLTRGTILRRHATTGTRFVLDCLNAATGHDKSKRELVEQAPQTLSMAFVARPHADVVRDVCSKRTVQTHMLMPQRETKRVRSFTFSFCSEDPSVDPFPFAVWI